MSSLPVLKPQQGQVRAGGRLPGLCSCQGGRGRLWLARSFLWPGQVSSRLPSHLEYSGKTDRALLSGHHGVCLQFLFLLKPLLDHGPCWTGAGGFCGAWKGRRERCLQLWQNRRMQGGGQGPASPPAEARPTPTLHSLFSVDMGLGNRGHKGPRDRGWTRGH